MEEFEHLEWIRSIAYLNNTRGYLFSQQIKMEIKYTWQWHCDLRFYVIELAFSRGLEKWMLKKKFLYIHFQKDNALHCLSKIKTPIVASQIWKAMESNHFLHVLHRNKGSYFFYMENALNGINWTCNMCAYHLPYYVHTKEKYLFTYTTNTHTVG